MSTVVLVSLSTQSAVYIPILMYLTTCFYIYHIMYSCCHGPEAADLRRDRYRRGRGASEPGDEHVLLQG